MGAQVVPQALSHAGELMDLVYAILLKLFHGSDARQHEQMRRFYGTGAQHHAVGFDVENFAAAFGFYPNGFPVFDQYLPYGNAASHGEIETVPHRVEIGHSGAHPDAVYVVRRRHADAGRVGAIGVVRGTEPVFQASCVKRLLYVGGGT